MCIEGEAPGHCSSLTPVGEGGRGSLGFSLIEVIMFILVVSVALVTVLNVFNVANQGSVDPVLHRQSLAIAQGLIEEIRYKPFANPAGGFTGAATAANRRQFDDVLDYNGLVLSPITDLANTAITGLGNYSASVAVTAAGFGGVPAAAGYRVSVTVTDPRGQTIVLDGYRAND